MNAIVGDNGVITNAVDAKQKQGMAVLEEWLQEKYVEYYDDSNDYINKVEMLVNHIPDLLLTNSESRKYIIYEGKIHYILNKESLPKEIKDGLIGGDTKETADYSKLIDVYGITQDLKVYYVDTLRETQYGNMNVEDVNPDLYMPKLNSDNKLNGLIKETLSKKGVIVDETKGITIDNASKINELTIDGNEIKGVTSLDTLSELLNLQELTLKNLELENLKGIESLGLLNYLYFDNCKIKDYSQMASVLKLKYLYFYFPNTMNEADSNIQITNFGEGLKNATRIKEFQYLYILGENDKIFASAIDKGWDDVGKGFFKYLDPSLSNLTDISGLEKLPSNMKTSVIELYLNNHKVTSVDSLSDFTGLNNLIIPCNPELHSLAGIENKKNLLYIAGQQPIINTNSEGKEIPRKDVGFKNLNGLKGCNRLKYLILYNNTNLEDISGIKDSIGDKSKNEPVTGLIRLCASNCNILSTSGLEGNGTGLDDLTYLDLKDNVNLVEVSQINLCDGLCELYLAGCVSMDNTQAVNLEGIIKKCNPKYSIPQKYSLGFSSVTSLDISGSDFKDSDLEDLKGKTNITRLRLQNCTNLSSSKINEVLYTMTNLQYLSLAGVTELNNINFVSSMKLVELDIGEANVTDLSPLNGESSKNLKTLRLKSTVVDNYTDLLTNLCNNAGECMKYEKNEETRKIFSSSCC